jgi:hypothetical protein
VLGAIIRVILPKSQENLDILSMSQYENIIKNLCLLVSMALVMLKNYRDCKLGGPNRLKVGRYNPLQAPW